MTTHGPATLSKHNKKSPPTKNHSGHAYSIATVNTGQKNKEDPSFKVWSRGHFHRLHVHQMLDQNRLPLDALRKNIQFQVRRASD